MTKEEKREIILEAVEEALESIAQAVNELEEAEHQTGYEFSPYIMQGLREGYMSGTVADLNDLLDQYSSGRKDLEEHLDQAEDEGVKTS